MKNLTIILAIILMGCKNNQNLTISNSGAKYADTIRTATPYDKHDEEVGYEMMKFRESLKKIYKISDKNPKIALNSADSLIAIYQKDLKSNDKTYRQHIISCLHVFKGEILHHLKDYHNSFNEFKFQNGFENYVYVASLYIKFGENKKALFELNKIPNGVYIHDLSQANYYEIIGDKETALKIYLDLSKTDWLKQYEFSEFVIVRIKELKKSNPNLLKEFYLISQRENL